jgi:hypothetical protein
MESKLLFIIFIIHFKFIIHFIKIFSGNSASTDESKKSENKNLNLFSVVSIVSGAVSKFKSLIKYKRIDNLQCNQLDIINDWTFYGFQKKAGEDEVKNYLN